MPPPAPALFTTVIGVGTSFCSCRILWISRAVRSWGPPGLVPTTISTGFSGFQACARPAAGASIDAAMIQSAGCKFMSNPAGLVFGMAQLAPRIELPGILSERRLVDIDAQARRGRQLDVAVLGLQLVGRDLVAELDE